jgi:RND family efflux transporter MFP subunit
MNLSETRRQTLFDLVRVLVTLAMVALAAGGIFWVTQQQHAHPWTRDGQVLANVVHVAPQVSGPVVAVHVVDNQLVAKGDPLFEIDAVRYRQAVQQAQANLAQASAEAQDAAADAERARALHARGDLSQQDFDLKTALAASGAMAVDSAKVALETARLNLGYTMVSAPSAGYVTNLELGTGTYAAAGEPVVALVDADSYFGTQWPLLRR